ncbi:MAG: hypothetical protein FD143_2183 [Ignavibacteria bacterium]|nr:MAG: hypothetical protein FD143_2183 [Ignavibacteria bacterium]KAF0158658.1 MAG: hypothetical protein FD188_2465 [Ignavibacteria bacterium]
MTNFEITLLEVDSFCNKEGLNYAVIGGMALIAHGVNRTTEDVDITLQLNLEDITIVGEKILKYFEPIHQNPLLFFQNNFVLPVLHPLTKIGIDFAAGLSGFDFKVIERKVRLKFHSIELPFASIEDIIIYKLFASRGKDILDLSEIAKQNKNKIDTRYLKQALKEFAELEREDMKNNFDKIFG